MRKINARVIRNIGTESAWLQRDTILGDGEVAFVRFGSRIRTKIGNGSLSFSQLSYQDNDLKVSKAGAAFPFLSGEGAAPAGVYMATESGTYQPGNVVVDVSGKLVMLLWDGIGVLDKVETELPEVDVSGLVAKSDIDVTGGVASFDRTKVLTDNIRVDELGNLYFVDENQNIGLMLTADATLKVFRIELNGEIIDLGNFTSLDQFETLSANFEIDGEGSFYIKDSSGNVSLKISTAGEISFFQNIQNFAANFNRAKGLLDLEREDLDYTFVSPDYVFGMYGSTRQYFTDLYPEALFTGKLPLLISESKKAILQNPGQQSEPVTTTSKTFELSFTGYKTKSFSVDYVRSNRSNLQGANIRMMLLSDSIVNQNQSAGSVSGTIANFIRQFGLMDNADIGSIDPLMVGTRNSATVNLAYKGSTLACKSFSEGRSGWATYNYLNYPRWVRLDGTAFEDAYTFLGAEAMYYLAGLATKTPFDSTVAGQPYTAYSMSQHFNICNTPVGRYKPDYNEQLWTALKAKWGFTTSVTSYSSVTEDAKMEVFLFGSGGIASCDGGVCYDPAISHNPFYDISRAQAYTGDHEWINRNAFSITKYLERYRTMDDSGNRLVLGNGTGYLVTDVNAYDVCTPSHFVEGLGTNDVAVGLTNMVYFSQQLVDTVASELPSCKIGSYVPRRPGVFYPQRWQEYGLQSQFEGNATMANYNGALMNALGALSLLKQINYIPVFFTQSPVSAGYVECLTYDLNEIEMAAKVVSGSDTVHLSAIQLRSIAYQLYSWLAWSIN
ncbi:hypothetical protein [Sphingobacterium sp. LRF_L2]|uniref:hypothetical protein n=1 Tax=Sphingobacterium sp. LRF_L2 TaxID=3369421 RepID=UPI003F60EED8